MPAEQRFRAMGSHAHLLVNATAHTGLLDRGRRRLAQLEARWSRFQPDSELCRINAARGQPVQVSADTAQIVRRSVEAWRLTDGLFDPTVLGAVEAAGYDRTFEDVPATGATPPRTGAPSPGCAGIEVDGSTVRLPAGVRLDLGGIGKGYAADQVAYELRRAGADGVCVNLGGDVRASGPSRADTGWVVPVTADQVAYELRRAGADGVCVNLGGDVRASGPSRADTGWVIAVTDPFGERANLTTVVLDDGAVATSSRLRRRWRRGDEELHHLVDPRTGMPSRTALVAVTVVAAQAHWAEILAKSALLAGRQAGAHLLETHGLSGLLVDGNGDVLRVGSMERYEGWTRSSGGTSRAPAV